MARLTDEATETLAHFERDTGISLQFHRSGSVKAAYTEVGESRLHADLNVARSLGIEVDLISPADAHRMAPWFEPGTPRAIGYVPSDAYLEPSSPADGLRPAGGGGRGPGGAVHARHLAAPGGRPTRRRLDPARRSPGRRGGGRGRRLGRAVAAKAGIRLPLVPVRHQLFITEPIPSVEPMQPIVRFLEASVYVRPERGGLMVGGYEDTPRVVDPAERGPGFQIANLELRPGRPARVAGRGRGSSPGPAGCAGRGASGRPADDDAGWSAAARSGAGPGRAVRCLGLLRRRAEPVAGGRARLADLILDGACEPDLTPLSRRALPRLDRFGRD